MEVLYLVVGGLVSAGAFGTGIRLHRWGRGVVQGAIALALLLAVLGSWPRLTEQLAGWGWGVSGLKLTVLLVPLGWAWNRWPSKWQRGLILLPLLALSAGIFLIAGSPVILRYGLAPHLDLAPDARGLLRQSTSYTCAPASAVMLLHRWGIPVTEGEMAVQARTGLWLGTYDPNLCQALGQVVRPAGLDATLLRANWDTVRRINRPFIAPVEFSGVGRHAVMVCHATSTHVIYADPTVGQFFETSVPEFLRVWTGTLIVVGEEPLRKLQCGDHGATVKELQQDLSRAGCPEDWTPGVFDEPTQRAVKQFQFSEGLEPRGVTDPATLLVLRQQTRPARGPVLDQEPPRQVQPHGPVLPRFRNILRLLLAVPLD